MNYIVKKAEMWRGEEGERKKTAVYDYIWEEEDVSLALKKMKLLVDYIRNSSNVNKWCRNTSCLCFYYKCHNFY